MASASDPKPRLRRLRSILLVMVTAGLALAFLAVLAVSDAPSVPDPGPPDAGDVADARTLAETVRDFVVAEAPRGSLTFDEDEVSAALLSTRRILPGLLGRFTVEDGIARMDLSAGGPLAPAGRWINLRLDLAASEDGLDVVSARVGRITLPAVLVEPVARLALDLYLGDGLGSEALGAISAVEIGASEMTVSFVFPEGEDTSTFFERLRARLRVIAGGEDTERIHTHLWWLHRAEIPPEDGLLPYFRHVVETARRLSKNDDRAELESALFALALYCGDGRLGEAAGIRLNRTYRLENTCRTVTLRGRRDLRKHFTVSAGLFAMRSEASVLGVGEIKELLDSGSGGSGFSLDDMAANASGLRFAEAFLSAPASDWPDMLDLIRTDNDILPPLDGLEAGMSAEEFEARFGDIDSPAYAAALAEIERRIDDLPLHARGRVN